MVIDVHSNELRGLGLTEEQALLDLAVGLYTEQRVTLGRAAAIAKITQADFQRELGKRGITIHHDLEDFQQDMKTLAALKSK